MTDSSDFQRRRLGAYGLRLTGLDTAARYLVTAPPSWPTVSVDRAGGDPVDRDELGPDHAEYPITGTRTSVRIDRRARSVRFSCPSGPDDETVVHPGLAGVASIMSRWLDRDAFHAGAFLDGDGRAWAVLGAKGAGKSSALGYLAAKGVDVVADDILVTRDGTAFAGPRFVDLRAEAADWLGRGVDIGVVGIRRRWRVGLPVVAAEAPLAGWVVPEWSDRLEIDAVPAADRLSLLCTHLGLHLPPLDPARVLELAALPFLAFRRPRRWDRMDESMTALLDVVADR